jgi:CDP-diacylglycerol---serine O-phosphatidyltransferase
VSSENEGSEFGVQGSENTSAPFPAQPVGSLSSLDPAPGILNPSMRRSRADRRLRMRRHGRRAYIRSVYFLPSMATLGNAICGFGAMYVAAFDLSNVGPDPWAKWLMLHKFVAAAYLIFVAMIFDALDGRLARFTRHTTDFGGQLDSLADAVSFGAAPAFIALLLFKNEGPTLPFVVTRLIWAIGALYFSCAAIRLARFNVSNEHGEQHHFSFLGLPSPGAAAVVAAFILMQQDLRWDVNTGWSNALSNVCIYLLPLVVLFSGLLMVSAIRYPHVVNRWLRGRRSLPRLIGGVTIVLLVIVAHRYVLGIGCLAYALYGPGMLAYLRARRRAPQR